jgi:HEPN superfamily AbiU2-like protein
MDTDQRRYRLIGWLDAIRADVEDLILDQHLFWKVQAIIKGNPRFTGEPGLFTHWMASSFAQASAIGVRRQAKSGDDSISLSRFLQEVRAYPSLVSREFYLSLFVDSPDWLKEAGADEFDAIAGKGAHQLPTARLDEQIQGLDAAVSAIEHYVDRRVAHYDQRGLARPVPTFKDLEDALKVLEGLVLFYWQLLKGGSISGGLLPTIQYDWQSVFTFPWIERHEEHASSNVV